MPRVTISPARSTFDRSILGSVAGLNFLEIGTDAKGLLTTIMIGEKLVVLVSGADAQSTRGVEESRGIWHFAARQPNDALVDGPHMQFRACGCVGALDLDRDFCSGSMLSGTVKAGSKGGLARTGIRT